MNAKKYIIFIVLVVFLIGGFIFFDYISNDGEKKQNDISQNDNADTIKEKVIDYLEEVSLSPTSGGEVFADYYKIGEKVGELYLWAYVAEYYEEDGELEMGSAHSTPVIVEISKGGEPKSFWEPRDGAHYDDSIKQEFPREYWNDVLGFQSEHKEVIVDLENSIEKRAKRDLIAPDIVLSVGDTETVSLAANPTTGYTWQYSVGDEDVADIVSSDYKAREHEKHMVGVGGKRFFKIKGLKKGSTVIKLEYSREWESKQPAKTKEFKVQVKDWNKVPVNLDTEYISVKSSYFEVYNKESEYPKGFVVEGGELVCPENAERKNVGGQKYCLLKNTEGAAGKVYENYVYTTFQNKKVVKIVFTLSLPQCVNYIGPERSGCMKERQNFNPEDVLEIIASRV